MKMTVEEFVEATQDWDAEAITTEDLEVIAFLTFSEDFSTLRDVREHIAALDGGL